MKIELISGRLIANLTITIGNTTITQDVANSDGRIPHDIIEQFFYAAAKMNEFNGKTDIDFVEWVANYLLDDIEHEQLIKRLSL